MTVEAKARDVFNKFYDYLPMKQSKECAIVLCDEVVAVTIDAWAKLGMGEIGELKDYIPYHFWNSVKRHIEDNY